MNGRNAQILVGLVVALAIAGGGFAAGRTTAPPPAGAAGTTATGEAQTAAALARRAALGLGGGAAGGAAPGGGAGTPVAARVLSVNDGSITVEIRQPAQGETGAATSVIALIGSDTRLVKTTDQEIKITDIKAGDLVTLVGTADATTGTVSANAVLVGGGTLQQLLGGQRAGAGGRVPGASPAPGTR